MKKKHPKFFRQNYGRTDRKRISDSWRKPRGVDNKKRIKLKSAGAVPEIGWRNPREVRHIHPCGMREVLVRNVEELKRVKDAAVRIASGVGRKKREEIVRKAKEMKLRVLNE
ncbi:MAG: 50S ribosomal protein L32e [Candidatus Micrarchaeia archaeon]